MQRPNRKEVETYNYMMFKRAHEQIYAESKETLENLQKFKEKLRFSFFKVLYVFYNLVPCSFYGGESNPSGVC